MNFFDYLNDINTGKKDIMKTPEDVKAYNSFMINRGLSYFDDTVHAANLMNQHYDLSPRVQYDFLRGVVTTKKRFSKWFKAESIEDLELVKAYFGYSDTRAKETLAVLTKNDIENIRQRSQTGGIKK